MQNDPVDALKEVLGAQSDQDLASKLGLERSTIAQWRRRGSLPARYRSLLDPRELQRELRHAVRRRLYGDSDGRYIMAAALAFVPLSKLDVGDYLSPGNVGWSRETLLLNVAEAVLDMCMETFGSYTCRSDDEFIRLMNALETPEGQELIRIALELPVIGEL